MFLRALTCFVDSSKSTLCSLDGLHSPTMATPFAKDLLLTLGFTKHLVYPAEVHQFLSPNDNKLHGTAKASWRNSGIPLFDDVQSSIFLLHALDVDTQRHSKAWFDCNCVFRNRRVSSSSDLRQEE